MNNYNPSSSPLPEDHSGEIATQGSPSRDHVATRFRKSRDLLDWLGGEFASRLRGRDSGQDVEIPSVDMMERQVAQVCELVNLALAQVDLHENLSMAWILLETARQQLGHAALAAGIGSRDGDDGDPGVDGGGDTDDDIDDVVHRYDTKTVEVLCLLQRELMPVPQNAAEQVDFGAGPGVMPYLLPDTPLELLSLQLLAHSSMAFPVEAGLQDLGDRVMRMALGELVSILLEEAMELLESRSDPEDVRQIVDTGHQVADLIWGAFPAAWEIFPGPAGFPGLAA